MSTANKNCHPGRGGNFYGGAEGNRTPVRKQLGKNFSGRSLLFTFPQPTGNKHPVGISSFMIHGARKALRTHGLHSNHTRARLVDLPGRMRRLIRQPEQQFCCQLNLKVTRFIVVRRHDPLIQPHYPRRNQYGPILRAEFGVTRGEGSW